MSHTEEDTAPVRPAAVAGRFYPGDAATLAQAVRAFLDGAALANAALNQGTTWGLPRAVIAPHAGYVCSGAVAGVAFQALAAHAAVVAPAGTTVYLIGPAHYVPVQGVGLTRARAFATPVGEAPVHTQQTAAMAAQGKLYHLADVAHAPEHSLEVELPFLQTVLPACRIVPMLFGARTDPAPVAADLAICLAHDPASLVVVSSDLSHFLPYAQAQQTDRALLNAIAAGDAAAAAAGHACGLAPILCLMAIARRLGWAAHVLDYRNSGDTCGPRQEVVGYGAVLFTAGR